MKDDPIYESVEHRFTDKELLALGKELARANNEVYRLRGDQKATAATMAAAVKSAEQVASELAGKISRRTELREVEVVFLMDKPAVGLKMIVRADTGEEIRTAPMSPQERQGTLAFEGKMQ